MNQGRHIWVWMTILFFVGKMQAQEMEPPKREFRAAWITTLANIEWPTSQRMPVEEQKEEFRSILDQLKASGMNAVVVQVRPAGDAFYPSRLVPWSAYLTGTQGKAPEPFYDPLAFMIEEAHARNLEFHAWFNPMRAQSHIKLTKMCAENMAVKKPEWTFTYGEGRYFNPGIPEVRNYLVNVIMEVVANYNVDGIHFDDYFYPYPLPNQPIPDKVTFQYFKGDFPEINAWRRNNINEIIHAISDSIQATKPWVKFGISPFGVWRNKSADDLGSDTYGMASSYDELHADVRLWLMEGWIDYVAPQLYWSTTSKRAPFETTLGWWASLEAGRHVYAGHGLYRAAQTGANYLAPSDILAQVRICQENPNVCGSIYFRSGMICDNVGGFCSALKSGPYHYPALVPPMTWKDSIPPLRPQNLSLSLEKEGVFLNWDAPAAAPDGDSACYYIVYRFLETETTDLNSPQHIVFIGKSTSFLDINYEKNTTYLYAVTSVDRLHNESDRFVYEKIAVGE